MSLESKYSIEKLDRSLGKTKLQIFFKQNTAFFASIMGQLEFVWDESISTAATNGKQILWNPDFYVSLDKDTRLFVLVHEIAHVAFMHITRLGNRNPQIYNIAADHVINTTLKKEGYVWNLPFEVCCDMKYLGWSTDRVYEDLIKNAITIPVYGMGNDIEYSDSDEQNETSSDIIKTIITARQAAIMSKQAGSIPGEIEELIDKYLNPFLPWETLLQNFFNDMSDDDYSYQRLDRRFDDPILPSLMSDGRLQTINWYIDTSGSISHQMLKRFFSEMYYVKESFNPELINIIQFDCRIQKEDQLEEWDDFSKLTMHGRGGTSLEPVRKHIMDNNPDCAIIFSDMECKPMDKIDIPILWCIFRPSSGHKPSWGQVVDIYERNPK